MPNLLRPATPVTPTVAKLSANGKTISVVFPEIVEKFNKRVKEMGYHWSRPAWIREINARAGTVEDRLVELACELLALGFIVELQSESLTERVQHSEYEPEHTRWITRYTAGKYTDWFCVQWSRREDYYANAKRLRGARYAPPNVAVPATSFEEVLDFAEQHDFRLSPGAQELAAQARTQFEQAVIVAPEPRKHSAPQPKIEMVGVIADELKDEPL